MTTDEGKPYYKVSELIELLQRNTQPDDVVMLKPGLVDDGDFITASSKPVQVRFEGSIVRNNNQRLGRHVAILS